MITGNPGLRNLEEWAGFLQNTSADFSWNSGIPTEKLAQTLLLVVYQEQQEVDVAQFWGADNLGDCIWDGTVS